MLSYFIHGNRRAILARAAAMITAIAVVDWRVETNVAFGFLYLFPMLMVGGCLSRWQTTLVALLCTGLAEAFDAFPFDSPEGYPRVILAFAAYFGTGLFAFELARNRQLAAEHTERIEREVQLRRDAEEQLKYLVESSPAAIFTLDMEASVLLANQAAHDLLGFLPGALMGTSIGGFIPALANVPRGGEQAQLFRTEMECQGTRKDGSVFLANIWFSTYRTQSGPRLAAVVADTSEELRDREEFSLQQLMAGSRIVVGAISHEIRNICGAIAVIHANLSRNAALAGNEDFQALGTLIEGLAKVASLELRDRSKDEMRGVDLHALLDELRIVVEPSCTEAGIAIHWEIPSNLPPVWADRHLLLQAFLNLVKNSERAMENSPLRLLTVRVSVALRESSHLVEVGVLDTGPGLAQPELLFKPFQPGAEATGLGLYVSRALVRAFKGDLRHEPSAQGCCFVIELTPATDSRRDSWRTALNGESAIAAAGRPHSLSRESEPAA